MELERFENYPWGRIAFKVLMDSMKGRDISGCYTINGFAQALQGHKGRRQFKEAILSQFDVEDTPTENIIKLMFVKKPWKWTMDCWEVTGTWVNIEPAVVSPAKKKSESVNGTNAEGRAYRRIKVQMCPQMLVPRKIKLQNRALFYWTKINPLSRIYRRRMLDICKRGMLLWHFAVQRVIEQGNLLPHSYNPFAPIDKKKLKELADWLKTCPKRYEANPQHFRSERKCFLDHLFSQQWRFNYKDFKGSEPDQNGLGRRLPGGAWNYYAVTIPSFCQSNKVWGTDIDDIYAPVNFADSHWIAIWISIPKRHIAVFDSICSSISPEELDVVMEHFLYMVFYLLVECASSDEQHAQYSLEPFTYERPTNIPPARAGDCGVYTLKYIECHALGIEFSKKDIAKASGKTMRDKMAVDIFQELPDAHEFENKDNDANLGAYEG
uniref:Ubiquitin-like protease family profile domain-containing protein n=1 Tax=Brassica oleracea var. oleracea TaxID=109376 RepID=A0A0D3D576_BRAOL